MRKKLLSLLSKIRVRSCIMVLCSSAILSFGLYQIHSLSGVTEGGVLGLTLLLQHWWDISPSISGGVLNVLCYVLGWKLLGQTFLIYSFIATAGFSASYRFWEEFEPFWPQLADMPLAAAIIGAMFVGIGTGFCVRAGGALSGDDALAMSISHVTHIDIKWVFLFSDVVVLTLSLSYIPVQRIIYSLVTVVLSGQIIGMVQKIGRSKLLDRM